MAVKKNANNVEETSINIAITSICAGYKESATSYEDAAKTTGVSVELIKSHIVSGKMINGYKFKLVG